MTKLAERSCIACRGNTPKLGTDEIVKHLDDVAGWKWRKDAIVREFAFRNFKEARAFFDKVADIAEAEDHHPDVEIYQWCKVRLSITTHAVRGLTENDFILAAKVDEIIRSFDAARL